MNSRILAALLALALFAAPGCADLCARLPSWAASACATDPAPPLPAPAGYVVTEGDRVERDDLAAGSSLAFDFTPARDGSAETEDVVAWAVGPPEAGWNGGNAPAGSGVFTVRVNAYSRDAWKLKVYSLGLGYAGEVKLPVSWRAGQTYAVRLEILVGRVRLTVDGRSVEVGCHVPQVSRVGYGWPPQKRQGALGARIENVVWTQGAGFPPD